VMDLEHKWGPAPFHYTPSYYKALIEDLSK